MITARTKKQLIVFVMITLIGVAYVGARYARLDRLFWDTDYAVAAHFQDSGGIFEGAEVTYRGVKVGRVSDMRLTREGIDVILAIDNDRDKIPADTRAVVGNKSAIGEQYVDLQPRTTAAPYLKEGSGIETTPDDIPVSTTELLTNVDRLVESVPQDSLQTSVTELGAAFNDTGRDLGQIIDTSNEFIAAANENFDVTSALIDDSAIVLQTQADKASAIKSFSRDLALFSGTLADNDAALRQVIQNGSATSRELRMFLEQNGVDLGQLINNMVTTGKVTVKHLKAIRQMLVLYPNVVEGSYSVLNKGPDGRYDASFGMILTQEPAVCHDGYQSTDRRRPQDLADRPMNMDARCTEAASQSSARGAQHAPNGRAGTAYRAPVVGTYDAKNDKLTWGDAAPDANVTYTGGARDTFGREDSWKWLMLQPVMGQD